MSATIPPLKHYLRLYKQVHPADDFTTTAATWTTVCDLWGAVKSLRSEQRLQNALADQVITHQITTRYHPDIPTTNETLRLTDLRTDKVYNVGGHVNVDGENERVEWDVAEVRT